jgi:hypothetical protein
MDCSSYFTAALARLRDERSPPALCRSRTDHQITTLRGPSGECHTACGKRPAAFLLEIGKKREEPQLRTNHVIAKSHQLHPHVEI